MSPDNENHYDAYSPSEMSERIEQLGVAKAQHSAMKLLILAILAGAFISMGALFFIVVVSESTLSFGLTRLIGGVVFSLGLIMVIIAGAELFTGNNVMAMAWADRKIATRSILRNWVFSYTGNVIGCLITVLIVYLAGVDTLGGGAVGKTALSVAQVKASAGFLEIFTRGILCNALVCIAVWMVMACRSVTDKVLVIVFPITAFVAMGFEHSIANWFFLPYSWILDHNSFLISDGIKNIVASTLGNLVGGTILVSGVYYLAYIKDKLNHP